mgnify:CR=1 FL=1
MLFRSKLMEIGCAMWVKFIDCCFDGSTELTAVTLTSTAYYVSFINSTQYVNVLGIQYGITAEQIDSAIAQGVGCYVADRAIRRNVGDAISFQNGWENYGGSYPGAQYWFDTDGNICLGGTIKSGSISSAAFTLPAGYRPSSYLYFATDANNAYAQLLITPAGEVIPNAGSNGLFNLNGIKFSGVTL